jgi:putative iron-dependent peroxidase
MTLTQPGILEPIPQLARYLSFGLVDTSATREALSRLAAMIDPGDTVTGIGRATVLALGAEVPGLRELEVLTGPGIEVPSTPGALWCWLRGSDRGELLHRGRAIETALAPAFRAQDVVDAFRYGETRDLTGYEDGTENPKGDDAVDAAVVNGQGAGLDGSSFVAVQQWLHDLERFGAMSRDEQDATFGRRRDDNEEIDNAPASAHVKRTAQESFEPEAFVVRRSMPWADGTRAGLVFVSFGHSLDAFDMQMRRMVGADDGVADALFRFTRPLTGAAFWCPPVTGAGRLDLRVLGI